MRRRTGRIVAPVPQAERNAVEHEPGEARLVLSVATDARHVAACLAGVVGSLLLVGVVSDTLARHVVQVVPVLAIWGVVMAAIWAYPVGLSDIASGTYSGLEVGSDRGNSGMLRMGHTQQPACRSTASASRAAGGGAGGFVLQTGLLAASFRFFA